MATLEELTVEATAEIEAAKPLFKQVDKERLEFLEIQQVKVENKIQQLSEDLIKIKDAIKKIKEKKQ